MDRNEKQREEHLGFLAALSPRDGIFLGGLLVTNAQGRPLEFQCTAPIEPNSTQVLLYGPTLRPYVNTELIGRTLVERVSVKPHIVLVDSPDLLGLRPLIKPAVGCVIDPRNSGGIRIGRQVIEVHAQYPADRNTIRQTCDRIPQDADLAEPFERVVAALKETIAPSRGAA